MHFRPLMSVLLVSLATAGCSSEPVRTSTSRILGWELKLGDGTVSSYAEFASDGAPAAIGVVWSAASLEGLPATSDEHRCHGRHKDGSVVADTKCQHTHHFVIPLPDAVARRNDIPFKWVLLNWNPHGHIPAGVYDSAHFDVHFQMQPIADAFAIEAGPCGPEFVRCDQFERGRKPLPSNYMPPDYVDVEAVVPVMGNHLIDLTGPEFQKQPFTRSWIYGTYDGKVIFYEAMVTRAFMLGKPNGCSKIKAPKAVAVSGFYPTEYCVRHDAKTGEHSVSMEKFTRREASAPEAAAVKG